MLAHFPAALKPDGGKVHQHGSLFRKQQPVHQEQPKKLKETQSMTITI